MKGARACQKVRVHSPSPLLPPSPRKVIHAVERLAVPVADQEVHCPAGRAPSSPRCACSAPADGKAAESGGGIVSKIGRRRPDTAQVDRQGLAVLRARRCFSGPLSLSASLRDGMVVVPEATPKGEIYV